ncbi:ABC transporter permease [Candidatus Bathyarchaeota archaeon]|nr:MAG: ABC transporter permease [Candidatus Bathyarchaeota archaeon]
MHKTRWIRDRRRRRNQADREFRSRSIVLASLKRTLSDLKIFSRGYLRNKIGLFFSLVFPIILILLFGSIFSGSSGPIQVYVQNQDSPSPSPSGGFVTALNSTNVVRTVLVDNSTNFSQYLLSHSATAGVLIPKGFSASYILKKPVNVTIYTNPADTSSGIVVATVNEVVNAFNLNRTGSTPVIGTQSLPIASQSYKYIDFLVPGLIGFTVLTSPMFSLVNISSEYKKTKLFKQLSLTPLTKGEWLTSKIIWYTLLSIISYLLMTFVGITLFGAHVGITPLVLPFLVIGPLFFVSLGMLVGTLTKSVESAAVVGNLITFPMMFLSGTFFPVNTMPQYLQNVAHVLPLFYVIDGLNQVMIFNNTSQMLYDAAIVLAGAIIVFVLAVGLFKWRED